MASFSVSHFGFSHSIMHPHSCTVMDSWAMSLYDIRVKKYPSVDVVMAFNTSISAGLEILIPLSCVPGIVNAKPAKK